jgi:TonB family protein
MTVHATARARRAAGSRRAVLASVAVAALAHVALASAADTTGLLTGWSFGAAEHAARPAQAAARARLAPSCDGDALLAAGARSLLCASPFVDDRGACVTELRNRLESDRIRCHLDQLAPTMVTITSIDARTLPRITAEMLLDDPLVPEPVAQPEPPPEIVLAPQQPPPPPPPAPKPPAPPPPPLDQQIVEVARATDEAPEDTRFVSEVNSKVDRQTVARGTPDEPMTAKPLPEELEAVPDPREAGATRPPDVAGDRPDAPRAPGALSMREAGPRKPSEVAQDEKIAGILDGSDVPRGAGIGIARGNSMFAAEARQRALAPSEGGAGGGTDATPDLRPSKEVLERATGGGSVDYLEDVEGGDETALSSRQDRYASFFNRMKRSVAQRWHPGELWQRYDPTLNVNGIKDRLTRVRVTLSTTGALKGIIVVEPSGVPFLDDEAIRAFRAAQPFPNPPVGLADTGGNITFNFGFHVSISGNRTEWRFFRE